MINFWFSIELDFSLSTTESRIYPTAIGEGVFCSSLYLCFLLFRAMKMPLSIEKTTAETAATGKIIPYLIFRFHEEMSICRFHELRHTHASLLLFAGVSIASVARRLGHASMTTTQKTYLHIIQELENKDVDLVMRTLSGL